MSAASPELMRAWARITKVQQKLRSAIERDLKEADALPLDWYDALLELERAPDGRLSPGALEDNMLIAQYSLSRLIDRLQREGLVRRLPHPEDGRKQLVEITAKGRKQRAASGLSTPGRWSGTRGVSSIPTNWASFSLCWERWSRCRLVVRCAPAAMKGCGVNLSTPALLRDPKSSY